MMSPLTNWGKNHGIRSVDIYCQYRLFKTLPSIMSSICIGVDPSLNYISPCWQDVVLMRALRDMNLPKFVFEDVPLFLGLIADLFPGLDCPRVRYPNFNDAVEAVLVDNKYVLLPHQVMLFTCSKTNFNCPEFQT